MAFDKRIIEAKLALDQIPAEQMPALAWDALEAGVDGKWVRRMAALDGSSWFEVRPVLLRFMEEAGLRALPLELAWGRLARQCAQQIFLEGADPLSVDLFRLHMLWVQADYPQLLEKVGMLSDDLYVAELYEGVEVARQRATQVLREAANFRFEDD